MPRLLLLLLLCGCSHFVLAQSTKQLEIGLRFTPTSLQHHSFSPYFKSGLTTGVHLNYSKQSTRPWYLQVEFHKGNLNSDLDGGIVFYELYDFEFRFSKFFPLLNPHMLIGPSLTLLDGIVAETIYSNNTILHDAAVPGLSVATLNKFTIGEKIQLENHFSFDILTLLSRNDYSNRPSLKFRLSSLGDRINFSNKISWIQHTNRSSFVLSYRFGMMRNFTVNAFLFQHGVEIGYRFSFGAKDQD